MRIVKSSLERGFALGLTALLFLAQTATAEQNGFGIVEGAKKQLQRTIYYDPAYFQIKYPGGDLPIERGVCTDVVIRALRFLQVDLQVLVHEDMSRNFSTYPKNWGLKGTDTNIDHRRVPNLMTFFKRRKMELPVTREAKDYIPGDFVVWRLPHGLLHIGIVSDSTGWLGGPHLIIHNIGEGAREEDILFDYDIAGHFRYFPVS
jgi:uncharacterized protein YijF (DUF1287 family)